MNGRMVAGRQLRGRCECRAVRYRVTDEFLYAANCHCSNCRAGTGSAFKAFAGIERAKLEVVEGADRLLVWGEDDANHTRCGVCGSLLYSVVRGRVRARRARVARRPPVDPAERAHLRRLEGALVRDHGRPAAERRVLASGASPREACSRPDLQARIPVPQGPLRRPTRRIPSRQRRRRGHRDG